MKGMKNTTSYGIFQKGGFVRSLFVVFLLITLFAPTSYIFTISSLNLDSVGSVYAEDYSDAADNYYYEGNSNNYYDAWGYEDAPSYNYGDSGDGGSDVSNLTPDPSVVPILDTSYLDQSDAADNYYYNNDSALYDAIWDYTNSSNSTAQSFNNETSGSVSTNSGEVNPIGGDQSEEVNPIGGDQGEEVNPIGGDQGEEVNPIGGDQSEEVNPIGGDEESSSFPWWLGLLAIPLIGGSDSTNPTAPVIPTVCVPVSITSSLVASGNVGSPFSYTITSSGSPSITYDASGLPAGLSFNGQTISGVPTSAGTYSVTITASNECGSDTETLVIIISPIGVCVAANFPAFTSPTSANGIVGNSFTHIFTTTGNTPMSYSVGNLPAGLTFSGDRITGVPTLAGTYTVTVTATNNCGPVNQTLTIVIAPVGSPCVPGVPVVTNNSFNLALGQSFSYQINTTNNPTSYSASPLPQGFSVSTSTGLITGIASNSGEFTFTVTATNNCGTGSGTIVITVPTGGGGGGTPPTGGGGSPVPEITLLSSAGAQPLASSVYLGESNGLYLNQIPYTGLGDAFLTFLFLIIVFIISAIIAYVSVYGKNSINLRENTLSWFETSYLGSEVLLSYLALQNEFENKVEKLIITAKEQEAVLTEDGAKMILSFSGNDLFKSYPLLSQIVAFAKSKTPEDQYVILTVSKIRDILMEVYMSFVPVYVEWIRKGESEKMRNFITKLQSQGFSTREFLVEVNSNVGLNLGVVLV